MKSDCARRKEIRVAFTDYPGPYNPARIARWLSEFFEVVQSEENPDYVIYSIFGSDYLKYRDAVRIFFVGENVRPDFNLCDYAFGYDWIDYEDRYCRCPNYFLYSHFEELRDGVPEEMSHHPGSAADRRFCNFVYSNYDADPVRDQFYHLLSRHGMVDSAGSHLRNVEGLGPAYQGDWWTPKVEFQSRYKFSIAFENSSTRGYTTEKLVHALAARTVPIYWGNPGVGREFNTGRFLNCHEFPTMEAVVERVLELNEDDGKYLAMLNQPVFAEGFDPHAETARVKAQLRHIFEQDLHSARRRNVHFCGKNYEEARAFEAEAAAFLRGRNLTSRIARMIWRAARGR